jgi:hypothetical protein
MYALLIPLCSRSCQLRDSKIVVKKDVEQLNTKGLHLQSSQKPLHYIFRMSNTQQCSLL